MSLGRMTFEMKNRKTAWINRKVYVYNNGMGRRDLIYPGRVDPSTGRVITDEDVRMLHAMDDAEVYNNRKNCKPKVQPWEEEGIDAWRELHPGESLPCRDVLSLDDLLENEDGGDSTEDKGGVIGRASMIAYEAEEAGNARVERMREIVMEMGDKYWQLYVLHIIEGFTFEEIGRAEGVSKMAISKRFAKIEEKIKVKLM